MVTTMEQRHFRSRAVKEAEDETVMGQSPFSEGFTPMDLVDFVVEVLAEKEKLMEAIADAKTGAAGERSVSF